MNQQQQQLWARISQFAIDEGQSELSFAARLSRENGWSKQYAERAIEEYRRFVFLAMTAGHTVTPSEQVDQVWHLHLTYTHSYWDRLCGEVLPRPLHHGPTQGGEEESTKYRQCYEQTLASYEQLFGEAPPADLWSPIDIRFGSDTQQVRVNTTENWIIAKPRMRGRAVASLGLLPLIGFVPLWGDGWGGYGTILFIAIFVGIVFAIFRLMSGPNSNRGGGGDSGCSFWFGGCGGDSGCASSGCGSGCGGGCGGD